MAFGQTNAVGVQSANIRAELTSEGRLQVEETIQYNFGNRQTTGFTRRLWIPEGGSISIDTVRRDDLSEEYRSTRAGNVRRIITGDSEIPLTGTHTYEFIYTIDDGVVKFAGDQPKAVWQAVAGSQVPADDITIRLTAPFEISQASCRLQETDRGCPVDRIDDGVRARLEKLPADRSIILQADLPSDVFTSQTDETSGAGGWVFASIIIILLLLAGGSYGVYYVYTYRSGSGHNKEPVPEHIDTLSS